MIKYEALNWESLEFLKAHLWRRLVEPLNTMVANFEAAQQYGDKSTPAEKLIASHQTAAALLNTINAWSTLISYRKQDMLPNIEFKPVNKDQVPTWVSARLAQQTSLRLDFTRSIRIHPETFWESLMLLHEVATYISQIAYIQIADGLPPKQGVYLRVIFSSKADQTPFNSLEEIVKQFDLENPKENTLAAQLLVARDMMLLNKAKFNLQNNKKTGQQAFSVYFEALDTSTEPTDHERQDAPPVPSAAVDTVTSEDKVTTPTLPPVRESINPLSLSSPTLALKPTPATEDDSTIIEVAESASSPAQAPTTQGSESKASTTESDASPTQPSLGSQR